MTAPNRDQAELWNNGEAVAHWIDQQRQHDQMLEPFIDILVTGAQLAPGDRVLDVGCGSGATTIAAARFVASGAVTGLDISGPLLTRARADAQHAVAGNITFVEADAQTHPFERDTFDAVISRFGIMFFDDPIAAFTNIHHAARGGGRLAFVCWQPLTTNEWLVLPRAVLARHASLPDMAGPGTPGMFAFADDDDVQHVLEAAGWHDITATDTHTPIHIGGHGTVEDAVEFLRTGSMGRTALAGLDPDAEARAVDALRTALEPHHDGTGVRLDAAVWLVTARA